MTDDRATRRLRGLIERPERVRFWGRMHTITPTLIAKTFGDGKLLICITPLATRPNHFVVRVDSRTEDVRDPAPQMPRDAHAYGLLDDIMEAAEEEFGYFGDKEERDASGDDPRPFPVTDWGIGVCWGEPFQPTEWVPTPLVFKRGMRVRIRKPKKQGGGIGVVAGRPRAGARIVYVKGPAGWAGHVPVHDLEIVS